MPVNMARRATRSSAGPPEPEGLPEPEEIHGKRATRSTTSSRSTSSVQVRWNLPSLALSFCTVWRNLLATSPLHRVWCLIFFCYSVPFDSHPRLLPLTPKPRKEGQRGSRGLPGLLSLPDLMTGV